MYHCNNTKQVSITTGIENASNSVYFDDTGLPGRFDFSAFQVFIPANQQATTLW
jgi:hypothetical protein